MQKVIPYLQIAISICCALFFVVPMYYSFHMIGVVNNEMSGGEMAWVKQYFYHDEFIILLVSPLFLIWVVYLFVRDKSKIFKIPLLLFAVGLTTFHIYIGYYLLNAPIQDFSATWGIFLFFILAPLLFILLLLEIIKSGKTKQKSILNNEIILDE